MKKKKPRRSDPPPSTGCSATVGTWRCLDVLVHDGAIPLPQMDKLTVVWIERLRLVGPSSLHAMTPMRSNMHPVLDNPFMRLLQNYYIHPTRHPPLALINF
jgi:hypothetical protein